MEKVSAGNASKMTSPNPVTIVCTETPDGKTNLATVSWWMYMSFNPVMIGFAMQKTAYSGELTRQNKKVVLAMPGAELADITMKCGSVSGRDTEKAKEFNIELMDISDCSIKVPVHSRLVFDCALSETISVGDHYLYLCNVNNIYADKNKQQVFAWDGYSSIQPIKE